MPYQRYQSKPLNIRGANAPTQGSPNAYLEGLQRMKDIQTAMQARTAAAKGAAGAAAGQSANAASNQDFSRQGPSSGNQPRYPAMPASPPADLTLPRDRTPLSSAGRGEPPPSDIAQYMANERGPGEFRRDFGRAYQPPPSPPGYAIGGSVGGYGMTPELLEQRKGAMGASMQASRGMGSSGRGFGG